MSRVGRRALVVVASAAVAAGLATAGTASAGGHDYVKGDHVTTVLAVADFHGRNATAEQGGRASGYFSGEATAPAGAFVAPQGPITCLYVDGNRAGFIYPLEDDTKPALLKGQAILITVEDGGKGGTDHMGFVGPAPEALFPNCHPGPTPLQVTDGDIVVHDEH